MKRKVFYLILFKTSILIFFSALCVNAQTFTTLVSGRVIDENGQPVKHAIIELLNTTNEKGVDKYSANMIITSHEDGIFVIENTSFLQNRIRDLFISSPVPKNAKILLIEPAYSLIDSVIILNSLSIPINGEDKIQLGDIPIQTWRGLVCLKLTTKKGKPYYKSLDEWLADFVLVLRDQNENMITTGGLSIEDTKKNINLKKGTIMLSIPEGRWKLDFVHDKDPEGPIDYNDVAGTTGFIDEKKANSPLPITIKVQK